MDTVHFLNIEYIVLRAGILIQNAFNSVFSWFTGTPQSVIETQGVNSPVVASHILGTISFTAEQLALLGMALAIIFLAAAVYIRIKLEVMEHEGFHAREAKYHGNGHGGGHDSHAESHDGHGGHGEHSDHSGHEEAPVETGKNARWENIMGLAHGSSESDWRRAIMEADIMLGEALDTQGYRGHSVGERLKDANPLQMTTLNSAWQAHKVRNDIAHGGEGYHLSERDAKGTIDLYRRVLEELGYI